ncbi:hypothetical protein DV735_g3961, partial [Chaetothyriales sp. CBS 134920]
MDKLPMANYAGVRKRVSNAGIKLCKMSTAKDQDLQRKADGKSSTAAVADPGLALAEREVVQDIIPSDELEDDVSSWLGSVEAATQHAVEAHQSPKSDSGRARRSSASPSTRAVQLTNYLAMDTKNYVSDKHGRPIHLGKSSNWSFGRRVLRMTCDRLGVQLSTESLHFEGSVYQLEWQILRHQPEPSAHSLPASDYAIYLINTASFHCGQIFHLFEEEEFMRYFAIFHQDKNGIDRVPLLWYVHYLLVVAFGKAFVARNAPDGPPPGAGLFVEAMRHLPEITLFPTDAIESIEILVCAALYLQCLDFRNAAYNLIGQALRKSLEQGMHTPMSHHGWSRSAVQRCRNLWWTVYILDRQMSSLMGVPLAVRDEDISAPLPEFPNHSQRAIGLELHVKLSSLIAEILNTVYSNEASLAKNFISNTKQALKSIAAVTGLLRQHFELPDLRSVAGISRTSAYLHLLHHQCIVLTTRPLAFSLLDRRLRNPNRTTDYYCPPGSIRTLLKTCNESAHQMLHILSSLQAQGLLESFLPFDLESVFISTIILIMSTAIDPSLLEGHEAWSKVAYSIFDEMASRGNAIAQLRKTELKKLSSVLDHLPPPKTTDAIQTESGQYAGNVVGAVDTQASAISTSNLSYQPFDNGLWPSDPTGEQLMIIADSLNLDGLDWMTTTTLSMGDGSTQSPFCDSTPTANPGQPSVQESSSLKKVPTWNLLRSLVVSFFLTRPLLLKPGMAFMTKVANSQSALLNPDLNPLLRLIIKPFIYDHFCAGTHKAEIQKNITQIKNLGFAGVILCYAKEVLLGEGNAALGTQGQREAEIQNWLKGNLETVDMLEPGNWIGIKMTGAGQDTMDTLLSGQDPPPAFAAAMDAIAQRAKAQGCRIWIDAEQQAVQATIERWTIDLMRKYNRGADVLIYTTIQAYLKQARATWKRHLTLAAAEGWNLGVKQVRGAYITTEARSRIHDTKEETDACYNGIVRDLLTGHFEGFTPHTLPCVRLFLASHNSETVRLALRLARDLSARGQLRVSPEFGQLQGMVDDLGGEVVRFGEMMEQEQQESKSDSPSSTPFVPRVYKCLTWGSVQECMQFLVRRATENSAAVGRMNESAAEARKELLRRFSLRS